MKFIYPFSWLSSEIMFALHSPALGYIENSETNLYAIPANPQHASNEKRQPVEILTASNLYPVRDLNPCYRRERAAS